MVQELQSKRIDREALTQTKVWTRLLLLKIKASDLHLAINSKYYLGIQVVRPHQAASREVWVLDPLLE